LDHDNQVHVPDNCHVASKQLIYFVLLLIKFAVITEISKQHH